MRHQWSSNYHLKVKVGETHPGKNSICSLDFFPEGEIDFNWQLDMRVYLRKTERNLWSGGVTVNQLFLTLPSSCSFTPSKLAFLPPTGVIAEARAVWSLSGSTNLTQLTWTLQSHIPGSPYLVPGARAGQSDLWLMPRLHSWAVCSLASPPVQTLWKVRALVRFWYTPTPSIAEVNFPGVGVR